MAMMLIDQTKDSACKTAEADAIRAKTGGSASLAYDWANNKGFADAIAAIPSGGNDRIQIRGSYYLSTITGLASDEAGFKLENFYATAEFHCTITSASAGRTFNLDFAGKQVNIANAALSTNNNIGAIANITADSDQDFVLNIYSGSQAFRNQRNLETITAKVIATAASADRTFLNCYALQFINFAPNKCNMPLSMGDCNALTDAGLVAIANGLIGGVARTVTLHATPKARCSTIMGTVSQVTEGGETYDFFTQDASGTVTLADFITNTKGWTLA